MTRAGGDPAPLRILVVNWLDRENPLAGGAEEHLHEVFGRLAARGHRVTALVSGWDGCAPRATLDGIDVHRAGRRYTFSVRGPLHYRRAFGHDDFDVVVEDLNKIPAFTPAWVRAPVVVLAHHLLGSTAFQAASPPVAATSLLLERTIPRVFAGLPVVAVSESTRLDLIRRGMEPERIEVIPNGIDVDRFTPAPETRSEHPTVVFLGRLKRYKRVDLVIDAMAKLRDVPHARLLIGGSGEEGDALRARADRLGLSDRVRFLGFVPEDEKVDLFRSAWLHVLTSPKEGWGITNLEAGACGTPTVASDAPGLRESVVHGRTGVLVPHGDVPALAGALDRLLADGGTRRSMGAEARAFAEGFTWDAAADAFETLLRRVVRTSGRE